MAETRIDEVLACMAGSIAGGILAHPDFDCRFTLEEQRNIAKHSVGIADEIKQTLQARNANIHIASSEMLHNAAEAIAKIGGLPVR